MNKEFWADKKVLITGHTGFKGSWLSLWLKSLGAEITGYALAPNTKPNLFALANIADGITSVIGNMLDVDHLLSVIKKQQPSIVFHLAAQPLVRYAYQNPLETYQVNVMGTANLLQAVRSVDSVRAVIVITSDKCYENQEWVWGYRETDAVGGFDPYSNSKACTELVVSAFRQSYFNLSRYSEHQVALATVRAGNVIGGGDWAEARLVPDLIRAFMQQEIAILRYPNAHRPWQYVLDVLHGYLLLAEQLFDNGAAFAEAWNFGPFEENIKPVAWLADRLATLWGKNAKWICNESQDLHEAMCLRLDSNKSRTRLNWAPTMTIEALLEETHQWYQHYCHGENMYSVTTKQINAYEERMR